MRLGLTPAALVHLAIGLAGALWVISTRELEGLWAAILWVFGVPWAIGAVALGLWPRSSPRLAWIVPLTVLAIGVLAWFVLAMLEAGAG